MNFSIYLIGTVIVFFLALVYYHQIAKHDYMIIFIVGFTWLLLMANNKGDNITYEYIYLGAAQEDFDYKEFLFKTLCRVGDLYGLTFWQFKSVILFLALLLICLSVKKYVNNIEFFFFLYLISFVFIDSQVIRNFVAAAIFMFSVYFLQKKTVKNMIIFGILLFLMYGIHSAFIAYSLCLILYLDNRDKVVRVLFTLGSFLTLVTFIGGTKLTFIKAIISVFINDSRLTFLNTQTRFGAIPVILLYFFSIWLMWEFSIKSKKVTDEFKNSYENTVFLLSMSMVIMLPLVVLNLAFYRIIKNITLLCYCVMAGTYMKMKLLNSRVTIMFVSIILAVGWLIFETMIYGSYETVVDPVINGVLYWNL